MTNPFSPCLNITCPHPDTCTANGKCLARVAEPVRYEVLHCAHPEAWACHSPQADPIKWLEEWISPSYWPNFTFRRTDDGSLWRVEAAVYGPVRREGDSELQSVTPARLVPVTTPQADSTNNPKEVKTCATTSTDSSASAPNALVPAEKLTASTATSKQPSITIESNDSAVASNVPPDSSNPTGGTEIPCIHEWFEGRCVHCEMPAKEFRRLKPSDPAFRNAVLDIVAEVFREAIELNHPHEPLPSNIFKAALNLKTK